MPSVSFQRDPAEHAEVMLTAGRRLFEPWSPPARFWAAIAILALTGLALEVNRALLMPVFFGGSDFPHAGSALVYFWPVFAIYWIYYSIVLFRRSRVVRKVLARLPPQEMTANWDADSISIAGGGAVATFSWDAFRAARQIRDRIELDTDISVLYIPRRAFPDEATYSAAFNEFSGRVAAARQRSGQAAASA